MKELIIAENLFLEYLKNHLLMRIIKARIPLLKFGLWNLEWKSTNNRNAN